MIVTSVREARRLILSEMNENSDVLRPYRPDPSMGGYVILADSHGRILINNAKESKNRTFMQDLPDDALECIIVDAILMEMKDRKITITIAAAEAIQRRPEL